MAVDVPSRAQLRAVAGTLGQCHAGRPFRLKLICSAVVSGRAAHASPAGRVEPSANGPPHRPDVTDQTRTDLTSRRPGIWRPCSARRPCRSRAGGRGGEEDGQGGEAGGYGAEADGQCGEEGGQGGEGGGQGGEAGRQILFTIYLPVIPLHTRMYVIATHGRLPTLFGNQIDCC